MIEGHGDDAYLYDGRIKYNFSSNIHPQANHSGLLKHLAKNPNILSSYPEPEPYSLEKVIAEHIGVEPKNVLVTNGATEAIYLIAQANLGHRSHVLEPTFGEYGDACNLYEHILRHKFKLGEATYDTDLLWICNPNNPTGEMIDSKFLHHVIDLHPECDFVIDQAYHRYTKQSSLLPSVVDELENLILLYSITKDFSAPGLRLGYIVACERHIEAIRNVRMPWSVSPLAIEGGKYLFGHADEYDWDIDIMLSEADALRESLKAMDITVYPSDTTFMLCKLPKGNAKDLKEYLIDKAGILIRDASNFYSLSPQHFRVSSQSPEANSILIENIKSWLSK